jgi:signal peptidase II
MLFYSIAFLAAALDQLIKFLVQGGMTVNQSIPLLGHALKLTYVRNTGAAFSLFVGFSSYLAVIGLVVSAVVVYLHYRVPAKNLLFQAGLALILGGSLGNLIDRIFRSFVIDYIDLSFWPVFNLADILINAGVLLLAYKLFVREGKNASGPA